MPNCWHFVRGQWFNSLWPSNTIQHQRTSLNLVQVMAWCLTAPSNYLNQYLLNINKILWHSFQGTWIVKISIPKSCLKFTHFKSQPHLPGKNELNAISGCASKSTNSIKNHDHPFHNVALNHLWYLGLFLNWTIIIHKYNNHKHITIKNKWQLNWSSYYVRFNLEM